MSEKILKGRSVQKHDTAENWSKATNFIPKQGEIIVYDIDDSYDYERFKIGDGTTVVSSLPFIDAVGKLTSSNGEIFNDYVNNQAAAYAHAEGSNTNASVYCAHAEGNGTTASNYVAHAEGNATTASGDSSHAEGIQTVAKASGTHAEGNQTIASSAYQHVQGKFNIEDTAGTYAHIVGNGDSSTARSNAHTLDWSGNAWFAGSVIIGENNVPLATLEDIAAKANAEHTHEIADVTNLQTTLDAKAAASDLSALQELVGDTSVATQISTAIASKADSEHTHAMMMAVTTAGTGAAYTATIDGITELTAGLNVYLLIHTTSTSTSPTLNLNSLGAKSIKRRVSAGMATTAAGSVSTLLYANRAYHLTYDTTYSCWLVDELTKPVASDLQGTVAIANGGTGATTVDGALNNLGIMAGSQSELDQALASGATLDTLVSGATFLCIYED